MFKLYDILRGLIIQYSPGPMCINCTEFRGKKRMDAKRKFIPNVGPQVTQSPLPDRGVSCHLPAPMKMLLNVVL